MNAQEAAKVIHLGMEKLSLSELMSVKRALQDEADFANEFKLVNGFAKAKLGTYARSTKEVQNKMSRKDALALKEMVEAYGWDNNNNLTADGKKALEIADLVEEREKGQTVLETVEKSHASTPLTQAQKDVLDYHGFMYGETLESLGDFQSADEAMKVLRDDGVLNEELQNKKDNHNKKPVAVNSRTSGTPLTQAQKDVLDYHGFMYGDTLESLGKYQSADAALKVLRDDGVLNSVSENKKDENKVDSVVNTQQKSIPLTPEQIKYLDDHGIMHAGTLESISWFKDRDESLRELAKAGLLTDKTPTPPTNEVVKEDDGTNNADLNNIEVVKNMTQLEKLSASINPLDEKDERFSASRAALNVLDVYDKEGKKYDVRDVLVEQAKLKTELDLHDSQKITKEDYVERLKVNIDSAVLTIVSGQDISNYQGDPAQLRKNLEAKIDVLGNAQNGKPGKVHVRVENVLSFMSAESARLESRIQNVERKIGNLPLVQNFKNKMRKLDAKGEKVFGEKAWGIARGLGVIAEKAAPAIGMAAVAGLGGPVGMGLYSVYTFQKYAMPFIRKYTAQPNEMRTGLASYAKRHKLDATMAVLYSVSGGLTLGAGVLGAVSSIGDAGTIAQATLLTKHTSVAKAAISGSAMLTRSAAGIYEATKAGDKKELKRRILIGVGSAAAFVLGYAARDFIGKYFGEGKAEAAPQSHGFSDFAQNNGKVFPITDRDGDGIPDTIDRDGGDSTANEPVEPTHVYDDFYHAPEVEGRSHESVIRLLTNPQVDRSEATLKAQMMIYRVGHMDDSVRQAFPSASDAQIAHAILLRAADVHKGDADELLRSLLGDENCRKLTMEQQIEEICKGLTGYNYGQRTDLPFGRNLDPNYTGMNTRSRFLLDDCDSERKTDHFGGKKEEIIKDKEVEKVEEDQVREVVKDKEVKKVVEDQVKEVVEDKKAEPVETPVETLTSPKTGKIFVYKGTQSGYQDMANEAAVKGAFRFDDGVYRYVDYNEQYLNMRKIGFSDADARKYVQIRVDAEMAEKAAAQQAVQGKGGRS